MSAAIVARYAVTKFVKLGDSLSHRTLANWIQRLNFERREQ